MHDHHYMTIINDQNNYYNNYNGQDHYSASEAIGEKYKETLIKLGEIWNKII